MRIQRVIASLCLLLVATTARAGLPETSHRALETKGEDVPADVETRLKVVLALEENAQFVEAGAHCAELLKAFNDQPQVLERVQPILTRVRNERRAAEELGFAASSLLDTQCAAIAEQRFKESDEVGRIFLRKAFREGPDALSLKVCAILLELKDPHVARLCAERIGANPQDPLKPKWIKAMWASIGKVDPATLPVIYNHIGEPDVARFLVAAVRRSGDDSADAFARLTHESGAYALLKQRGFLDELPSDALTVHLKFAEKTGAETANSAGENRPNASIQGAKWADGNGKCNALAFTGAEMVVLNDKSLELGRFNADFTVSFWLYLNTGAANAWRNITHKGNADDERTFAIWAHPNDNALHYRIGTYLNGNEGGDTPTELPLKKWIRITYVKRGHTLQLFLDSRKDAEAELSAGTIYNTGPLYIGKDPWYAGIDGKIGDYRIYTRALLLSEIQLLSAQ